MRYRWLTGWTAILLAVACGASKTPVTERAFVVAASFNPVKECETSTFGRYVRGATCPGVELLFISREPSPELLLAGIRAELASLGQPVERRSLHVNGHDLDTISVVYGQPQRPLVSNLTTALAVPNSRDSIEVQCFSREHQVDPKRCSTLLDSFIEQGLLRGEWPSVLTQAAGRRTIDLDLAGHQIRLPGSCDELGAFAVSCPDGEVQMHLLQQRGQLSAALQALLARRADATLALQRNIECTVEGITTMCVVRRFRRPFGDALHTYTAALEIRGVPTLIACETRASHSSILPGTVCSRFFSFGDLALEEPTLEE